MNILVIDSGTTMSRVRLTDGDRILASVSRKVGARDVALTGSNETLKQALRECIDEAKAEARTRLRRIEAVVASGMISSNVGLREIAHLHAPVNLADLASAVVREEFFDICDVPIHFVPGVKCGFGGKDNPTGLEDKDMMRGEEAEIFGYLAMNPELLNDDSLFMHYGSHHKCIRISNGHITGGRTSITGELMMAIAEGTVLKGSLLPIDSVVPDWSFVSKGLETAEHEGFGRALFLVRVLETMEGRKQQEVTSFYLGALISLDFAVISRMVAAETKRIVLYGRTLFPSMMLPLLQERYPHLEVVVVTEEESGFLSARGAYSIYQNHTQSRRRT